MDCLSAVVDGLPERTVYPASKYSNRDAVNSAFSAFFFQFPSLLRYMLEMEEQEKRSNVQSLFDVSGIPSDNEGYHNRRASANREPSLRWFGGDSRSFHQ